MLGNLQIYRRESEPRDKKAFLWIHHDDDGRLVAQVYNGARWETISDSMLTTDSEEPLAEGKMLFVESLRADPLVNVVKSASFTPQDIETLQAEVAELKAAVGNVEERLAAL